MKTYDILVIGVGPAGMAVSAMAPEMGLSVCSIEKYRVGGECMNVGCIPSKALLKIAHTKHLFEHAEQYGLGQTVLKPQDTFSIVAKHLDYLHTKKTKSIVAKADVISGEAHFIDAYTVQVDDEQIQAKKIFIATGTKPAVPPIPGLADVPYLTNETIFALDKIPERLFIIGGGAIGCEMAQAFARLGSQVTLAHMDAHLLPQGHDSLGTYLESQFIKEKIRVINKATIRKVERDGNQLAVFVGDEKIPTDTILVAAGRKIDVSALALEKAGVMYDKKGIIVNDYLQTSQSHIYAVGDCNGQHLFSHAAMHQGMVGLMNSLIPRPWKIRFKNYVVPRTVFTEPQLAFVGKVPNLTPNPSPAERGASRWSRLFPDRIECIETKYEDYGAAVAEGIGHGRAKARIGKTGKIYAAAIAGEGAGEMINERTLAIQQKLRITDIMMTQHSFPTMGFLTKRVAETWMMNQMPRFVRLVQRWKKVFW